MACVRRRSAGGVGGEGEGEAEDDDDDDDDEEDEDGFRYHQLGELGADIWRQLKVRANALRHLVARDPLAADVKLTLFASAVFSYRYASVAQPLPHEYERPGGIHLLTEALDAAPALRSLLGGGPAAALAPPSTLGLLLWLLTPPHTPGSPGATLRALPRPAPASASSATHARRSQRGLAAPDYLFEVDNPSLEEKWRHRAQGKKTVVAYLGDSLDVFHSIVHRGITIAGDYVRLKLSLADALECSTPGYGLGSSELGARLRCVAECECVAEAGAALAGGGEVVLRDGRLARVRRLFLYRASSSADARAPYERHSSLSRTRALAPPHALAHDAVKLPEFRFEVEKTPSSEWQRKRGGRLSMYPDEKGPICAKPCRCGVGKFTTQRTCTSQEQDPGAKMRLPSKDQDKTNMDDLWPDDEEIDMIRKMTRDSLLDQWLTYINEKHSKSSEEETTQPAPTSQISAEHLRKEDDDKPQPDTHSTPENIEQTVPAPNELDETNMSSIHSSSSSFTSDESEEEGKPKNLYSQIQPLTPLDIKQPSSRAYICLPRVDEESNISTSSSSEHASERQEDLKPEASQNAPPVKLRTPKKEETPIKQDDTHGNNSPGSSSSEAEGNKRIFSPRRSMKLKSQENDPSSVQNDSQIEPQNLRDSDSSNLRLKKLTSLEAKEIEKEATKVRELIDSRKSSSSSSTNSLDLAQTDSVKDNSSEVSWVEIETDSQTKIWKDFDDRSHQGGQLSTEERTESLRSVRSIRSAISRNSEDLQREFEETLIEPIFHSQGQRDGRGRRLLILLLHSSPPNEP